MKLMTDNFNTKDFWILLNDGHVTIANQKNGETAKYMVQIKRKDFDRMIKWYTTEQKLRKAK
jgi:hypothetical protein